MKVSEIQTLIFEQTGIKTSVKKMTGSMKFHYSFTPQFQGGEYPKYPYEWAKEFIKQFKTVPGHGNYFVNGNILDILSLNFTEYDPISYKKERKPKTIEQQAVKQWGSKNSQLRLDKATARNAKRLRAGTTARYY
jgi:pyruvate formate-lyase activating enzyme-like uncharacterized protein